MLFVMSAFVAFNGFPGQDVEDPIGTLLVKEPKAAVKVPAHPVRVEVRGANRSGTESRRGSGAQRAGGPVAHTGPVSDPTPSREPTATQAPAQQPVSAPVDSVTRDLPGNTAPSLPDTNLPAPPQVTLPPISTPSPQDLGLSVDTSGILGGP